MSIRHNRSLGIVVPFSLFIFEFSENLCYNVITVKKTTTIHSKSEVMTMTKEVLFLTAADTCITKVIVEANTNAEAFELAEQLYKTNNWTFDYADLEIPRWCQ